MWATLSRSWAYAKTSYGILWDCKKLVIFPIISGLALLVVSASFLLPLWTSGTIDTWLSAEEGESDVAMYAMLFVFYFCNYFVIVFFNCALIASALRYMETGETSLGYGLRAAVTRMFSIIGWALVSAIVGVLLRLIENSHKRAGEFISAILGTAWSAMTFFVVPVIVLEGAGPFAAFKRSLGTLRHTWGTALVGNFSLGLLGLLVMLPVILVGWLLISTGSLVAVLLAVALFALGIAVNSAADTVFKGILFSYATDRTLPSDLDTSQFGYAFEPRQGA